MDLIERVENLYDKGEYRNLLEFINQEDFASLSDPDKMYLLYFKARCNEKLGEFDEALKIAQEGKLQFQSNQDNYGYFSMELIECTSFALIGRLNESDEMLTNAIYKRESYLKKTMRGKRLLANAYNISGIIKQEKGDIERSLFLYNESLKIKEEIGDKLEIAITNFNIASVYQNSGEYIIALQKNKESQKLFEEIGNKYFQANCLVNIANIYSSCFGNLETSLVNLQRALEIHKENDIPFYRDLANIGEIYRKLGKYSIAIKVLNESLKLAKDKNDIEVISDNLFNLFLIGIDKQEKELIDSIFGKLNELSDEIKTVRDLQKISYGLYYHNQEQMREKFKSITYFEDIIEDESVDYYLRCVAIMSLCELNLLELKITPSQETLEKTVTLVNNLYTKSQEQQSFIWLIESLILLSKLSLINSDIETSVSKLTQALKIAKEKQIPYLVKKAEEEHSKLLADLNKWQLLASKNTSLVEKLQFSDLENYIKTVKRKISF